VVQNGHLHTHSNKDFLDTIYALKSINGIDIRGTDNVTIGGATSGNGLALNAEGAFEIDTSIVATKEVIGTLVEFETALL